MFFSFMLFLLFMGIAGLAIGTLLAVKVWFTIPNFLILIAALCSGSLFIGVLLGATIFSWLPLFFTKMMIILLSIGTAIFFFRQFHPSYGYVPYHGWIHWAILGLFFFLVGLDFALIGFSSWLLLFIFPIFAIAILGGVIIMLRLKTMYRARSLFIYLPLLLFVFLGLVKLV
ncbi:hypothetical protein QA612_14785 [Evansella sp. AB-P1]|uniref:hypothetical protein n=1 Tax=Evansella sp. AB-P1 TaxID=3037653 RepID=UPI00241F28A0|nr:hypothetical protein [Evansella sp. AB-P1]MDG5788739.1 hypothetical protein [Evansella sp. AB-P1]